MDGNPVIQAVTKALEASEDIEGAFVFGAMANQHRDAFSDVQIGIVAKNTAGAHRPSRASSSRAGSQDVNRIEAITTCRPVHGFTRRK